jgi:hypothetical protein
VVILEHLEEAAEQLQDLLLLVQHVGCVGPIAVPAQRQLALAHQAFQRVLVSCGVAREGGFMGQSSCMTRIW